MALIHDDMDLIKEYELDEDDFGLTLLGCENCEEGKNRERLTHNDWDYCPGCWIEMRNEMAADADWENKAPWGEAAHFRNWDQ